MRQVTGWLTGDNQFFVQREEAALYEATKEVEAALLAFAGAKADFTRFMYVVNNLRPEIRSYLDAAQALQDREEADRHEAEVSNAVDRINREQKPEDYQADLGIGEVLDEANEQQPTGGFDAVPDMGTRTLAETLRELGAGYGSGGRGVDAQSVQRGEDLAVVATPEVGEARDGNWEETLRSILGDDTQGGRGSVQRPTGSSAESVLRDIAQFGMARQPSR